MEWDTSWKGLLWENMLDEPRNIAKICTLEFVSKEGVDIIVCELFVGSRIARNLGKEWDCPWDLGTVLWCGR
jgi:hypothetical protein